jgi:hypothetical protein
MMNRILLGTILGIALGIIDVLLTLRHGGQSTTDALGMNAYGGIIGSGTYSGRSLD